MKNITNKLFILLALFAGIYQATAAPSNTATGQDALHVATGSDNTADGQNALYANTTGNANTATGEGALFANTSGIMNTATGEDALSANTTGGFNTATGQSALVRNKTGGDNTADGQSALQNLLHGSGNIAVGGGAGQNYFGNEYNNIDIGNGGVKGENSIIRIGQNQTATYLTGSVFANNVQLTCDRNAKENFSAVNAQDVLAKVAVLPVTEWNYKTEGKAEQHIGPTAQDFQAVFQLSADDKHIAVVDEGGVALAAIQGLNQKLEQKDTEIQELKQQNNALAKQLDDLKQAVQTLMGKK